MPVGIPGLVTSFHRYNGQQANDQDVSDDEMIAVSTEKGSHSRNLITRSALNAVSTKTRA